MNSLPIEQSLLKVAEGMSTGLRYLVIALICIFIFNITFRLIRVGRNLMSTSRKLLIKEAELRGLDMTPYIEYNTEQLYEIVQGLLAGLDISNYANPDIPAEDMYNIRTRRGKVDKEKPAVELPTINEIERLGFNKRYLQLKPDGPIEYKLHASFCDIKLNGEFKRYGILKCQEGLYLYRTGLVSFFLEGY